MEEKKGRRKWLMKLAGFILSGVIIVFFAMQVVENWNDVQGYLTDMNIRLFVLAVVGYAVAFVATGYNWACLMWDLDGRTSRREYLNIHMVSALARYMPGGIWNIIGKAFLCSQLGIEKTVTAASIILEYVFQITSSALFFLCFLPVLMKDYLSGKLAAFLVAVAVVGFLLLPWAVRLGVRILSKIFRENMEKVQLKSSYIYGMLLRYVIVWIWTGMCLGIMVQAFTQLDIWQKIYLVLAYPVSWVVGFLSPSPNGMGVREGILGLLLDGRFAFDVLLLVTLVTRIWTILGEGIAFLVFKVYDSIEERRFIRRNALQWKSALFVTTKNADYIRNVQEIRKLKEKGFSVTVIGSCSRSYVKRLCHVYRKLLVTRIKDFDLVFVGFAPQLVVPIFRSRFQRTRLVIDFFISFYDTLVFDRKKVKEGTFAARCLKWLDTVTIQAGDFVVSDTKVHGRYFAKEFGVDTEKLVTLYLEADTSIYHPIGGEPRHGGKGQFVVLYFGSILPLQGVEIVLKSAEILKDREDIHFLIIGPLAKHSGMQGPLVEWAMSAPTVTCIPWLEQAELAKYIEDSDLCLAGHFHPDIQKARRTIPGKAFIYQAMGKPMVLGDNPANRELFDESMEGVFFTEMGDAEALSREVLRIKDNMIRERNTNEVNHTDTML